MTDKISQYAADADVDLFDGDMTGEQARDFLDRLGLDSSWLAAALGVKESTVERWEGSHHAIPYSAADLIFEVFQRTRHAVAALAADLASDVEQVPLVTYNTDAAYREHVGGKYTAAWHRAAIARVNDVTGCGVVKK